MWTSLKVALPEPAIRMRRMMTSPGSISTGRAPILPSTTTVAFCAAERRLSPNVPVTTFSRITSAPCLPVSRHTSALNFRSGRTTISSAPARADDLRLVVGAGHRDDARLHALRHLDLMQAQPAARAGDQHGVARLGLRDAERRAHAGADRADRECRRGQVETIRHADRVARRHAGELGVAAAAVLAEHAAVAAHVLPAGKAKAAGAAEQPLIEHDALADAARRRRSRRSRRSRPRSHGRECGPACRGILPARDSTS